MIDLLKPRSAPDRLAALAQYRRRAHIYDIELAAFEPVRRAAIASLDVGSGDVVLDVGCGTGLSFELLQRRVGAEGAIFGIEQSEDMIALARERVERNGWSNVTLLNAPVETAEMTTMADAALFHFTHDIMRNADALANVARRLRPGAHIVASGLQWADFWAWPVNLFVWPAALHSVTSLEGLSQPWSKLACLTSCGFRVQSMMAGGVYVARGERAS